MNNAEDLVKTAIEIRSQEDSHLKTSRANMLMQTGLEEVAKASFMFEKYMDAMLDGKALISNEERSTWLGGKTSHYRRVERIHHLYALLSQMTMMPGTSVAFNKSVEELLEQRNAGLYVDFMDSENRFTTPAELSQDVAFTTPSFAQEVLSYTKYKDAISHLAFLLNEKRKLRLHILNKIREVIDEKRTNLDLNITNLLASESSKDDSPFTEKTHILYGAYLIGRGGVSMLYTVFRATKKAGWFLMDNAPNQLMIDSAGSIRHYELAKETQEDGGVFRIQWRLIQSYD